MRKVLTAAAAAVIVLGGAYYGIAIYPTQYFRGTLDQSLKSLPAGTTASYRRAEYSLFSHRASLSGVHVHATAPYAFDLTADRIDAVRPATDLIEAWATEAANPAAVPQNLMLVIADSVDASGIRYSDDNQSFAVAKLHVENPRLYPWALLRPGIPSLAAMRAKLLAPPPYSPEDVLAIVRTEASLLLGFGYDNYVATQAHATVRLPQTPHMPATVATYDIRSMSGTGYDRGNVAAGAIEGITLRSDAFGSIGIDRVVMDGVTMRAPLTRLLAGEKFTPDMLDGFALKRLAYGPMAIQPPAGPTGVLGTFSLADIAFAHGMPVSAALSLDGLTLSRAQIPDLRGAEAFDELGLDTMTLSLGAVYRWDLAQKRMTLDQLAIKVKELGALTVSIELDDAVPGPAMARSLRLGHSVLRYDDASFVGRAIKIAAAKAGTDPAAFRNQLIAAATQMTTAPGGNAATAAAGLALAQFLAAPHSLVVDINPPRPLPAAALFLAAAMPPQRLIELLGLTIAADK